MVWSKHAVLQKMLISKIKDKTVLILFFDSKGVIHHEYVSEGQTVNVMFYVQVLDRLCKLIARVRPEMGRDGKFFPFHDKVHPHTAAIVKQFLAKKGVAQLSHPSYVLHLSTPSTISFSQN